MEFRIALGGRGFMSVVWSLNWRKAQGSTLWRVWPCLFLLVTGDDEVSAAERQLPNVRTAPLSRPLPLPRFQESGVPSLAFRWLSHEEFMIPLLRLFLMTTYIHTASTQFGKNGRQAPVQPSPVVMSSLTDLFGRHSRFFMPEDVFNRLIHPYEKREAFLLWEEQFTLVPCTCARHRVPFHSNRSSDFSQASWSWLNLPVISMSAMQVAKAP